MTTKHALRFCRGLLLVTPLALPVMNAAAAAEPPDFPPIVHLLATDPAAAEEGADTASFAVFRIGPTNEELTVHYVWGGSASNGADYATLSGAVTIPAGSWLAPITITPNDDPLVEGAESVILGLVQPLSWPPPYLVSWPSVGAAFIEDNDAPPTNHPPVVRLVNPPDGSVFTGPLDLKLVAHASDFDGRVVTVEFFDGDQSLGIVTNRPPIIRPHPLLDQLIALDDERDPDLFPELDLLPDVNTIPSSVFRLLWEDVPPGPHTLTALATDNRGATTRSAPIHIRVTDPPPRTIVNVRASDPVATEPDPSGSRLDTATFVIARNGPVNLPLTVFYRLGGTASNGVDYAELPHSATILAGARSTEVIIKPLDDALVEGPEKVTLTLVPPICIAIDPPPPECYLVGRHHTARAVINDNDPANRPPVVQIVRPLDGSVFLAPADIGIAAQARDLDGRVVSVEFFEGTNSLGVVSNNPALLLASQPQFAIKWTNVPPGHYLLTAKATDDDGAVARSRPVEIKVVDRLPPPVVSIVATDAEAAEVLPPGAPNTARFAVTRTGDTPRPLLVFYSVSGTAANGVDYPLLSGRLLMAAGASSSNLVIAPIDDRLVEGTETVRISLEPPVCIAIFPPPGDCYVLGVNHSSGAVIRDNDVATTNHPPRVAILRPEEGDIFEARADIVISAEAKDADGFVRTVEFFEGTNSLGVVSNNLSTAGSASNLVGQVEQIFRLVWNNVSVGRYVLTAKATDNRGAMTRSEPVRIRVIEANSQPVVTLEATDPWASEGGLFFISPTPLDAVEANAGAGVIISPIPPIIEDVASFTVKRDRGTNNELTVYYSVDGTAANGADYRRLEGKVTIPRGAWRAPIIVDPIDDDLVEGTETVAVSLEPIACPRIIPPPPECYLVGEPSHAVAYIRDNDFSNQPPRVSIASPQDGSVFLAPVDIRVAAAAADSDGWVATVEFFANDRSLGIVSNRLRVLDPIPLLEADLAVMPVWPVPINPFVLVWSNVPPGDYKLTALATDNRGASTKSDTIEIKVTDTPPRQIVTIEATDPDAAEVLLSPAIDPPIGLAYNSATFLVKRRGLTNDPLTVFYRVGGTASNGVDYWSLSGEVLIMAGRSAAEIVVRPFDDRFVEGTETVTIELLPPICIAIHPPPPDCYLVGDPARAIASIRDNDFENRPPRVAIVRPMQNDRFREKSDIQIIVQTVDPDGYVPRMEFFANGRSIGVEEILFFVEPPPGQLQRFSMIWSNVPAGRYALTAQATDDDGAIGTSRPVAIEVVDIDPVPVVNIHAPDAFAREGSPPNTATFVIRRSGATNTPLTVFYSIHGTASNGVDYLPIPESVTIAAGRRGARILISPIDDRRVEDRETVVLRLEDSHHYDLGRRRRAGAVIIDNDQPRPHIVRLPDGLFHFSNDGSKGLCFRLQASSNLRDWEDLDEVLQTDDAFHFVDAETDEYTVRFFRYVQMFEEEFFDEE